ncbi:MAG: hypothetical protein WKF88_10880 [Ferruginibacter sp.]
MVILPAQMPFISYPYEWSFDMWRDAALVTLKIAIAAMEKSMMLKDATPFNIQFYKGRPVFIDTLSFEKYDETKPWIAYRQFCECFLAPLLLMHYDHRDTGKLFLTYPDGIPLDLVRALLPARAKWNLHVHLHITLQAKLSAKAGRGEEKKGNFSMHKLAVLLNGLIEVVKGLKIKKARSEWDDYYSDTISGDNYLSAKTALIKKFTDDLSFNTVIDLGANDGFFSMMLRDKASHIIATDADSNCVNELYRQVRKQGIKNIVPLVSTLHHPSPAIGWMNKERDSLTVRLKADLVLALALVHHLAITANLPLESIARWLHNMGEYVIIEFVPKSDEKVRLLLKKREDIFTDYSVEHFTATFKRYFTVLHREKAGNTDREIFLMKRN